MRPWQDIARELASESDRERVMELAQELNRALEEQVHVIKPTLVRSEGESKAS